MKINTLNTVKEQYRKDLEQFIERASIEEINQLSNSIHHGMSKKGCGSWSTPLNTFTSCDNENCQMLSEHLGIMATLLIPHGRPEFLTSTFDGNTKEHQKKQKKREIAQQYYAQLPQAFSLQNQDQLEIAYANILKKEWSSVEELASLINRQFNHITLIGHIEQKPEINDTNTLTITFTLITPEFWPDKDTGELLESIERHRVIVIGELAELIRNNAKKGVHIYLEGKNKTHKWQDENGNDHVTTEVIVDGIQGAIQTIEQWGHAKYE